MNSLLLANSLSPVMWRTLALLLVGNAIIGLIEGLVVARVFRFPPIRTTALFIAANYCSMWFGTLFFGIGENPSPLPEMIFDIPLHHTSSLIWSCIAISFAVSCVIEWPFCWYASRLAHAHWKRSVLAVILAQSVSYPLLILLFSDSTNTIGDQVVVASLKEVVPDSLDATIYFIGTEDGALYEVQIGGSDLILLKQLNANNRHDVLGWLPPEDSEAETWQLILDSGRGNDVLLEKPVGLCEAFRSPGTIPQVEQGGWWLMATGIADLRPLNKRDWTVKPHSNSGIWASQESTKKELHITFDTPFVSWWGRCITLLPNDIVVFELGKQVCILSLQTRKIAFLARGRGPVVLLHNK